MENVIEDYLKDHINDPMSDVLQGIEETLQARISDRRFKLKTLAASSNGSGISWCAVASFCGRKYYISVLHPWAMCPSGKVTAGKID